MTRYVRVAGANPHGPAAIARALQRTAGRVIAAAAATLDVEDLPSSSRAPARRWTIRPSTVA
jgi:hypothetical protein